MATNPPFPSNDKIIDRPPERLMLCGTLRNFHNDWITTLATSAEFPDRLLTGSRDKTVIVWKLEFQGQTVTGVPLRSLRGHSHFISDLQLSLDSNFAITGSWDKSIRLWDLRTGQSTLRLTGHTGDVLGVSFSNNNRQIVSGSRDGTIRLWNTLGHCKFTFGAGLTEEKHTDWVSCIKQTPMFEKEPMIVSGSWDRTVQTWDLNSCKRTKVFTDHKSSVYSMDISPDGSLCVTGGRDGRVCLYDLLEESFLSAFTLPGPVNCIKFNTNYYWIGVGVGDTIMLYNLESRQPFESVKPEMLSAKNVPSTVSPDVLALTWSGCGNYLFTGHSDNIVRIWKVTIPSSAGYSY